MWLSVKDNSFLHKIWHFQYSWSLIAQFSTLNKTFASCFFLFLSINLSRKYFSLKVYIKIKSQLISTFMWKNFFYDFWMLEERRPLTTKIVVWLQIKTIKISTPHILVHVINAASCWHTSTRVLILFPITRLYH